MSQLSTIEQICSFGHEGDRSLLLLHPWWGVTPAIIEWADFLAEQNRRVLILDLYGGSTATTIDDAEKFADVTLRDPQTLTLLERTASILSEEQGSWTAMGFSLGAFLACHLAGREKLTPDEFILFYGGQPPSVHTSQTRKVEFHCVPDDDYFTEEEFSDTRAGFEVINTELEIYHYDDCRHWFAERGSPNFDAKAYNLARSRVSASLSNP